MQCGSSSSVCGRTLRVFSTSPQGSLLTKSMPVKGVPVGGSNTEASIIRYSTFSGLLYNTHTYRQAHIHIAPGQTLATPRKYLWYWINEETEINVTSNELTVMLLYSSSNMSRKISSPLDDMIQAEARVKKKPQRNVYKTDAVNLDLAGLVHGDC